MPASTRSKWSFASPSSSLRKKARASSRRGRIRPGRPTSMVRKAEIASSSSASRLSSSMPGLCDAPIAAIPMWNSTAGIDGAAPRQGTQYGQRLLRLACPDQGPGFCQSGGRRRGGRGGRAAAGARDRDEGREREGAAEGDTGHEADLDGQGRKKKRVALSCATLATQLRGSGSGSHGNETPSRFVY